MFVFQCSEIYLISPREGDSKCLFKGMDEKEKKIKNKGMDDIIQVARQRVTEIQHNLGKKATKKIMS